MTRKISISMLLVMILTLISAAPVSPATAKPVPVKDVEWAAKVNGKIIPMLEYDKAVEASLKQTVGEGGSEDSVSEEASPNNKLILEAMIEAEIINQWAKAQGIQVTEKEITGRITAMKKEFPSNAEFHKSLATRGMSVIELKRSVSRGLLENKLIKALQKDVSVSDEDIEKFYEKNIDLYSQKGSLHVKQILVASREKALNILEKLKAGESFEELAKTFSEDEETRNQGGDLGVVGEGQLPEDVEAEAVKLAPGAVSGVIESVTGFYIVKVEEKMAKQEIGFSGARQNIRRFLMEEKARASYVKALEEQKKNATIIVSDKLKDLFL